MTSTTQSVSSAIAFAIESYHAAVKRDNQQAAYKWKRVLDYIMKYSMPLGSGFDAGTSIDEEKSNASKLVFITNFHHMNDAGMYVRWTDHRVTVTATFNGFKVKVSGANYRDIKDYIAEMFAQSLDGSVDMATVLKVVG